MKYLVIAADYLGSCIRNEFNGLIEPDQLGLPDSFVEEIKAWHEGYIKIFPYLTEMDNNQQDVIEKLDNEGILISKKLKELIPGGAKIKYYSAGKLKYLLMI